MRRFATLACLLSIIGAMVVTVSYSVTLYRLFCEATGAGGTTQRVAADTAARSNRLITVRFNTDTAPGLPWRFRPLQSEVKTHLGEQTPVFFEAENLSDEDIVGHATFNVTPDKAGLYFKKIECFCFTEERLGAHQTVQMPVEFYVDPDIAASPATADVTQITLSYTFFRSTRPDGAEDLARFNRPDAVSGQTLFASQCGACHGLNEAKVGPPLAGVIGRTAGRVGNYPYTAALKKSDIVWSDATLDRWLAGPREMVPGVAMPMAVTDPLVRQAIIAYLNAASKNGG